MEWLVGGVYRRLVYEVVGGRDVQNASIWSSWLVEGCTEG